MFRRLAAVIFLSQAVTSHAEVVGEVNTSFHITGSDKVVVEAYDDPLVNVTCYVSRPKTGGIKGSLGLAEDKSDASIACRPIGDIHFRGKIPQQEDVFNARLSLLFKTLHVVRIADVKRNTLVYLTYSDRVADGSPKSSVTAVTLPVSVTLPLR